MSKPHEFIQTDNSANINQTMNNTHAIEEHQYNRNQMYDDTQLRGTYDKISMTRVNNYKGPTLNQLSCCFGNVQPVQRKPEEVNYDLGCEKWLQ